MKRYTARVTRDRHFWVIHIAELDCSTQALHRDTVEHMARDLVALLADVDPDSFALDVMENDP